MWTSSDQEDSEPFLTLLHGEPWFGNALFKYKTDPNGDSYPSDVIVGDLQVNVTYERQ